MVNKENTRHYTWGNNCDSWIMVDTEGLSVKQELMPPGTNEELHVHEKARQFFFVLNGTAVFYVNGQKQIISAQQGLSILPGTNHFIANESNENLEFLVISQPSTTNDRQNI
ncbi:MAG TPA: cupin domain-containing protein [Flavobacteriales bacterium]|nr:cupin domain-containing protein [Flavobacteriales bacterium]